MGDRPHAGGEDLRAAWMERRPQGAVARAGECPRCRGSGCLASPVRDVAAPYTASSRLLKNTV